MRGKLIMDVKYVIKEAEDIVSLEEEKRVKRNIRQLERMTNQKMLPYTERVKNQT
jgi:hypothetical protein